jgi:uracil-DNA glycosylase family 4
MTDQSSWPPAWKCDKKGDHCEGCSFLNQPCFLPGSFNPNATLTVVFEAPGLDIIDPRVGLFCEPAYRVVRKILDDMPTLPGTSVQYNMAYAVGAPHKGAPKKKVVVNCHPYLRQKLHASRQFFESRYPEQKRLHVVLTLGATATKALIPSTKSLKSVQGKAHRMNIDGYEYVVVPTFGPLSLLYQPGLTRVMKKDLTYAWRLSRQAELDPKIPIEMLTKNYVYASRPAEIMELAEHIVNYTNPEIQEDPKKWPIGLDIETNTLFPYQPDARVNVLSVSWDEGKAATIVLDHPDNEHYDPELSWRGVDWILQSAKPKMFHNGRFDLQFIQHRFGHEVRNILWDTLLAEHFIDEDKKGQYGLKVLTGYYVPEYRGYENMLQQQYFEVNEETPGAAKGQTEPDSEKSWELAGFFPNLEYIPASSHKYGLEHEQRIELFGFEHEYLMAHVAKNSKGKTSARGKIQRRCKKWEIPVPASVVDVDFSRAGDNGFEDIPLPILQQYAAVDADVTRQIAKRQLNVVGKRKEKNDCWRVMNNLYSPGTLTLSRMEFRGTRLDVERLATYEQAVEVLTAQALQAMRDYVCEADFNPASNDQLARVVMEVLVVDPIDYQWTETGALSVTKDWVTAMAKKYEGTSTGEFMYYLQVHRAAAKTASSFLSNFRKMAALDGRIHTRFNLNGTATGRLSSAGPNLQNVPMYMCRFTPPAGLTLGHPGMNIKALFIPTSDEYVYWQLDIAAAEIRVLCAYADDEKLIQALIDGLDIHSFIASNIFDIPYDVFVAQKDIDPEIKLKRTATKRVVFGIIYGAGPYTIAEQIYGTLAPEDTPEREAQISYANDVMDLIFERFPKIRKYISDTKEEVQAHGQVRTFFGRRRRFPLRKASWKDKARAQRMAVNFKIQSTASDIVLSQLCEVEQNLGELDGRVLLTVHDSMGGEIHRSQVPALRAYFDHYIVNRVKERFPWLPVPFSYDLEVGPNYGEMIAYEVLENGRDNVYESDKVKILKRMDQAGLTFFDELEAA